MNVRLYFWQRLTATIMLPMVLVHLAVIFYATQKGLSAADILARTRGSIAWGLFYSLFVLAVAVHAPIGLRTVLREWTGFRPGACALAALALGFVLLALGLRAVAAVVLA